MYILCPVKNIFDQRATICNVSSNPLLETSQGFALSLSHPLQPYAERWRCSHPIIFNVFSHLQAIYDNSSCEPRRENCSGSHWRAGKSVFVARWNVSYRIASGCEHNTWVCFRLSQLFGPSRSQVSTTLMDNGSPGSQANVLCVISHLRTFSWRCVGLCLVVYSSLHSFFQMYLCDGFSNINPGCLWFALNDLMIIYKTEEDPGSINI